MASDQPTNPVQGSSVNPTAVYPQDVPNNPDASPTPIDPNAVLLTENPNTTNPPPYTQHIQQPISSTPIYASTGSSVDNLGQIVAESPSTTPHQKEDETVVTQQPQEGKRKKIKNGRTKADSCADGCILCLGLCIGCCFKCCGG